MVAVLCNYTNATITCGWFTHCCADHVGCCLSVWTVVWTAVTLLAGLAFLVLLIFWACRASAFRSVQVAARRRRQGERRRRTSGTCSSAGMGAGLHGRRTRSDLQAGEPQSTLNDKRSPSPPPLPPPSLFPAPRRTPPSARAPSPAPPSPPLAAATPPSSQQPRARGSRSRCGGGSRRERSAGPGPGGGLGPGGGGGSGSSCGGGARRARPRRSFSEHEAGCKLRADGSGIKECNCGVGMIRVWSDAEGLGGGPFISVQGINPSH